MNTTAFLILSFSSLFAVIDPLGVIPFFSGLTAGRKLREKRKILVKALITAFFVLLMFTVVGHQLLELFGITVDAFRIAGGVIFFGIGLDMLQSKPRRWHTGVGKAYAKDMETSEEVKQDSKLGDTHGIATARVDNAARQKAAGKLPRLKRSSNWPIEPGFTCRSRLPF